MPRSIEQRLPVDTFMFSAQQLHPRVAMSITMGLWARWLETHMVPFPRLIKDHGYGVVVVGVDFQYLRPFNFFSSDAIEVSTSVIARKQGQFLEAPFDFKCGGDLFARAVLVARSVVMEESRSLAAAPGAMPDDLLAMLEPDEIIDGSPERPLQALWQELEQEEAALAEGERSFTIHRHQCEAADQWSYSEVPVLVADSRESLALEKAADHPVLQMGLGAPLKSFTFELLSPFFIFGQGRVETRVFHDGRTYQHQLLSGEAQVHARVVETF